MSENREHINKKIEIYSQTIDYKHIIDIILFFIE